MMAIITAKQALRLVTVLPEKSESILLRTGAKLYRHKDAVIKRGRKYEPLYMVSGYHYAGEDVLDIIKNILD